MRGRPCGSPQAVGHAPSCSPRPLSPLASPRLSPAPPGWGGDAPLGRPARPRPPVRNPRSNSSSACRRRPGKRVARWRGGRDACGHRDRRWLGRARSWSVGATSRGPSRSSRRERCCCRVPIPCPPPASGRCATWMPPRQWTADRRQPGRAEAHAEPGPARRPPRHGSRTRGPCPLAAPEERRDRLDRWPGREPRPHAAHRAGSRRGGGVT